MNCRPLLLETTALPTEPQPRASSFVAALKFKYVLAFTGESKAFQEVLSQLKSRKEENSQIWAARKGYMNRDIKV